MVLNGFERIKDGEVAELIKTRLVPDLPQESMPTQCILCNMYLHTSEDKAQHPIRCQKTAGMRIERHDEVWKQLVKKISPSKQPTLIVNEYQLG